MSRLRGILSLLVIAAVLFLALRAIHVGIPLVYPRVLRGPFSLGGLAEVEEYTGFSPLVPFFRPQALGERPVHVTANRPPRAAVVVFWQGDRFLYLEEREGAAAPPVPENARTWSLEGPAAAGEHHWWRQGRTIYAVTRRGDLWIELRTDLSDDDARRVLETLRPYQELL
jgi:hypothetical protein